MSERTSDAAAITLRAVQQRIEAMYGAKDAARGVAGTFMWLMEEVGELATALREQDPVQNGPSEALTLEFADVLAWLATIANIAGVDLAAAFQAKYGSGCPGCGQLECVCSIGEKP